MRRSSCGRSGRGSLLPRPSARKCRGTMLRAGGVASAGSAGGEGPPTPPRASEGESPPWPRGVRERPRAGLRTSGGGSPCAPDGRSKTGSG
eukprot:782653-Alexandrium_andersonii.AAC.1